MEEQKKSSKAKGCGCGGECGSMELELESAKKQAEDNLNLAKYQKAEFENYKKRHAENTASAFVDGKMYAIINVLPLLDNLAEALKSIQNPADREGMEILYRKFESILSGMGLEEIKAVGEVFSPHLHNCISRDAETGKPSNTVTQEWQKGYKFAGKVIRPTTVSVAE